MIHFNSENNNILDVSLCEHFYYCQAELEIENGDNFIFSCSSSNEITIFEEIPKLREIKNNEKEEEQLYFIDKSKDIENESLLKFMKEKKKDPK